MPPPSSPHRAFYFILFYFISPFLLLKSSSRSRYHTRRRCTGTTATVYARGMTIQPRPPARKPPRRRRILPLAPTPAAIRGHASYVYFFFVPFLTNVTETLYPTRRVLKPPPLYHIIPTPVLCPSSLASHAAAIACIRRHTSKDKFFFFFFFV